MRISTKDRQIIERQEVTLEQYAKTNGFLFDELVAEKVSGAIKASSRPEYLRLKGKLRSGDILVVTDLDRLGRDADDVIRELKELKELGVRVVALDIPYMNEWNKINDSSIYNMVIDIVITIKAHMAQQEREKIVSRINQGLAAAREKGTKLGRPKVQLPVNFLKEYNNGRQMAICQQRFCKDAWHRQTTLYKYIKIYERIQPGRVKIIYLQKN